MVRVPSLLAAACVLSLAACTGGGDGGGGEGGGGSKPEVPTSLADLDWDLDDSTVVADTCGSYVVHADLQDPLQVVDVTADHVVLPEVTPPPGSTLEVAEDWQATGGCVPTPDGPVVVVETQAFYVDADSPPPKVYAGFTPEGEQIWVRELPGDHWGSYDGRGSIVVDQVGPEPGAWLVIDALTGETLAEGDGEDGEPVVAVARDLALTVDGGVLRLPGGEPVIGDGVAAQVDKERMLVDAPAGLRLVGLADGSTIWERPEAGLLGIWSEAADLSTGVVVAESRDGAIIGLDLATGEPRWTSPLDPQSVNPVELRIGSGVLVLKDGEDLDQQVLLSTETGEQLPAADGDVVAGQEVLLLVDEDGRPRRVTVDDLR